MALKRVVSPGFGRSLCSKGFVRFLGFVRAGETAYALLSPWGGPGCLWVVVGFQGRPSAGVSTSAAAWVRSSWSGKMRS